jgi:hypothetical protein
MSFQVLAVIDDLSEFLRFDVIERVCQAHLAKAVMVTIGLTVGGDVNQFRPGPRLLRKGAQQPLSKLLAVVEKSFKGDGARDRPVIEEGAEASA